MCSEFVKPQEIVLLTIQSNLGVNFNVLAGSVLSVLLFQTGLSSLPPVSSHSWEIVFLKGCYKTKYWIHNDNTPNMFQDMLLKKAAFQGWSY